MCSFTVRLCLFSVLFFGVVSTAPAALVWQNTEQHRSVEAGQAEVTVTFCFMNAGSEPVEILNFQKSCTCLTEKIDKMTYAPGESGVLQVIVDLRGREGLLKKSLMVITDDRPATPTRIGIEVNIAARH